MSQLPFQFSDVFGSLVPGLVLCAIVAGTVVDLGETELGAAALTVVLAYVVGLLLHEAVRPWAPPDDPGALDPQVRTSFLSKVRERFGDTTSRDAAFLLARAALVSAGRARYAEQFQAMQAMCRGLVGAFVLGAAWLLGTGVGALPVGLAVLVLFGGALVVGRSTVVFDRMFGGGPFLVLPAAGAVLALAGLVVAPASTWGAGAAAVGSALALLGLGWLAHRAHDRYAGQFAEEVIRGFLVLEAPPR